MKSKSFDVGIIGLGYVGLPLSVEFARKRNVVGFDVNKTRIEELKRGIDSTNEVKKEELLAANFLKLTANINDLRNCNCYIITVPTPIDQYKRPDLSPLHTASETIGRLLKKGDIVIYESTVYQGCTEDECVPLLEKFSGLKYNRDFYCGYSPERINPGDNQRKLTDIKKITSGSTPIIADAIDDLYGEIILATFSNTAPV